MRIIAGSFRSRALQAPAGLATRPTSDRMRETLFDVLAPRIEGAVFLDLYAGSGAVGIEALSRGAAQATFVERSPAALKVLRENLARLDVRAGFRICTLSVAAFLRASVKANPKSDRYQVVFLDPPYDAAREYAVALELLGGAAAAVLEEGAIVVAEHRRKEKPETQLKQRYGALERTRLLPKGDGALSFYATSQPRGMSSPDER